MANDTFFSVWGDEPWGFVGQDTQEDLSLKVHSAKHSVHTNSLVAETIASVKNIYIHKTFASTLTVQTVISDTSINSIHRLHSSLVIPVLIAVTRNAIHKHYFYDKWNARFNYDCGRYIDTPYRFRLIETPGCNKCDPSTVAGDPAETPSNDLPGSASGYHNDLLGLQGGVFEEYYHLTLAERNKLAIMTQGSFTYVDRFRPNAKNTGDGWVNPDTSVLEMYYNTQFNGVSVQHSSEADKVDGGYF